jgi:NAD(P)-dependent dehydrogenase (short-subunit alcohol dehydrogenase family)
MEAELQDLAGRTAIITGGANGIGRGTAVALARRQVNIVIADIATEDAEAAVAAVNEVGGDALYIHCDVGAEDAFETLKSEALTRFGRIDIVMNNVARLSRGKPDLLPLEEWRLALDVNILSVVRSNGVFLPYFIERGEGYVINTSSFAGLFTYAYDRLAYATTKAALVQMSEGLALYLRPLGVDVTLLCPGPVVTKLGSSIRSFGPPIPLRTPGAQFQPISAGEVGEMVVDAVLNSKFMVVTHPEVRDLLLQRAADWNAFLDFQMNSGCELTPPGLTSRLSKGASQAYAPARSMDRDGQSTFDASERRRKSDKVGPAVTTAAPQPSPARYRASSIFPRTVTSGENTFSRIKAGPAALSLPNSRP